MLIDLTVDSGGARQDVRVDAPEDTAFRVVHQRLAAVMGAGAGAPAWTESGRLDDGSRLDETQLITGAVVGLGAAPAAVTGTTTAGTVRLAIVSGPGAGRSFPLPDGVTIVGRDPGCDVVLPDPTVSRRHAEITVSATGVRIRDLGSRNGTASTGHPLPRRAACGAAASQPSGRAPAPLRPDEPVAVGHTVLALSPAPARAAPTRTTGGRRLVTPVACSPNAAVTGEINVPGSADRAGPAAVQWLTVAVPAIAGGAFAWFSHNPEFLAFALLSPVMAVAQAAGDRVSWRRLRRRSRRLRAVDEQRARGEAARLVAADAAQRRSAHPDPVRVLDTARLPGPRLWTRVATDADALTVRLGTCTKRSAIQLRRGASCDSAGTFEHVPALVDLAAGPVGLAGPAKRTVAAASWLIGQLAVALPPSRLRIVACVDPAAEAWQWLRWLPHLVEKPTAESARTERDRWAGIVAELAAQASTAHGGDRPAAWTILVLDSSAREVPGLAALLAAGPRVGITAVVTADAGSALPAGCAAIAICAGDTAALWTLATSGAGTSTGGAGTATKSADTASGGADTSRADAATDRDGGCVVLGDAVDDGWPDALARSLAGLRESGANGAAALPAQVRLLDLVGLPEPTPDALLTRWASAGTAPRTAIGVTAEGLLELDLAADGPHALIAGTTGAGKSELLQTLVAGLAAAHAPADLAFVLIDYKGGAAFADCARLPHTVAVSTDLDEALTRRALQSLDAELRRREAELARLGVPGLDALGPAAMRPFGRLVLVVDEFAALAQELPDFLQGLVAIAQRGRSLGVHLVLATQRPAGVVSPEIRANTALRIALRTTDAGESVDIVGDDRAANLGREHPGRAIVRTGTRAVEMQAARVTAPAPVTTEDVTVMPLDRWRRPPTTPPEPGAKTDLAVLVAAAREAALRAELTLPASPWLPPLPDCVTARPVRGDSFRVSYGLADLPSAQRQEELVFDVGRGDTLLLVGGRRSGKTTVLRAICGCAAQHLGADDLHLYVLDFAGGALTDLGELPHCGSLLGPEHLAEVDTLLDALLESVRTDQDAAHTCPPAEADDVPARVVVVDGWDRLAAASEEADGGRTVEKLVTLIQFAGAGRLSVLLTSERAALSGRVPRMVAQKAVLRLTEPSDASLAGIPLKAVSGTTSAGRALLWGTDTLAQLAALGPTAQLPAQQSAVRAIAAATGGPTRRPPLGVQPLPRRLRLVDVPPDPGLVVLGVGGRCAEPIRLNLAGGSRLLVSGPNRSGRSTTLATLMTQLAAERRCLAVAGPRSPLARHAAASGVSVVGPTAAPFPADLQSGTAIFVDDCETLLDSALEAALLEQLRRRGDDLAIVVAGRTNDLLVTFRGLGAEVRKARCGILLNPGRGDGELLGLRLAAAAAGAPGSPGRGLGNLTEVLPPAVERQLGTPCSLQVALP